MRVCTQLEGAGGGVQRGRSGGEFKAEFYVGLEDGFMIPQLHHNAGELEKQKGNKKHLSAPESNVLWLGISSLRILSYLIAITHKEILSVKSEITNYLFCGFFKCFAA